MLGIYIILIVWFLVVMGIVAFQTVKIVQMENEIKTMRNQLAIEIMTKNDTQY